VTLGPEPSGSLDYAVSLDGLPQSCGRCRAVSGPYCFLPFVGKDCTIKARD
jgi:hypothetical protein